MVHPAVYAFIAFTGVVVISYKLYEEYQDAKMYEQYQRHRTRYEQEQQQHNHFERKNKEFDESDEEDTLRRRRPFNKRGQNGVNYFSLHCNLHIFDIDIYYRLLPLNNHNMS